MHLPRRLSPGRPRDVLSRAASRDGTEEHPRRGGRGDDPARNHRRQMSVVLPRHPQASRFVQAAGLPMRVRNNGYAARCRRSTTRFRNQESAASAISKLAWQSRGRNADSHCNASPSAAPRTSHAIRPAGANPDVSAAPCRFLPTEQVAIGGDNCWLADDTRGELAQLQSQEIVRAAAARSRPCRRPSLFPRLFPPATSPRSPTGR